ncbi:type I-E CRISPR-associated protein Cas6/Cse3/CasE [Natronosporangium hydrolyticum]|uniref:type I-E CRISPR-associated protein Cas6/Cse3/CasE n=1 Tax=Natronosporangium hydrolyticum TaxID=2811111 RepID=UPI001EFA079C|nr:type I-E CRISPR-associated protein Cas6/Cse3/CasE [Natronosporangium hydrolyticum]
MNTARRGARKLLSSPQAMHAAVLAGFAEPPSGAAGRVLWRIDHTPPSRTLLYLTSPVEPDLTHLVEQAGWPTTETWQTRPYAGFLQSLTEKQEWAFRITANPVRNRIGSGSDERTRRYGHSTVAHQQQWLLDRAERCGFRILHTEAGDPELTIHRRETLTFPRNGNTVTLRVATYDGRLEVVDADRLRAALSNGIGHAKAYGCGLMTLAPAGRP